MRRRSGGLFVGPRSAENGAGVLAEALELYRARIDFAEAEAEDLHSRMQAAAYLLMPALSCEREPRTVIEAFANALPVIASRIAPLAELVEPGRNGLLFEPGSARELSRRLAWAEAFPEKMRQMGECAQADYAARFGAHWNWQRLYGERRRQARAALS